MSKFKLAVAGTLDYLSTGVESLKHNGYFPELIIEGHAKVIDFSDEIRERKIDLCVCLAHPNILTGEEIRLFKRGSINLHAGLPQYRGRHPVNWMLIDGVNEIPVSVHYINEGIDTGNILISDSVLIDRNDDYNSVLNKILKLENNMLLCAVKQIETNSEYQRVQHKSLLRYTMKRTPDDSVIDWSLNSNKMHNFIRALVDPMPNAFALSDNNEKINFRNSDRGSKIGEVLAETLDGRYVISTYDGVILVTTDKKLKLGANFKFGENL